MDEELLINYDAPVSDVPMIQWFPGHMAKTRRLMEQNLKYVDIVVHSGWPFTGLRESRRLLWTVKTGRALISCFRRYTVRWTR